MHQASTIFAVLLLVLFFLHNNAKAQQITWYPCYLYTKNMTASQQSKLNVQCAHVPLPISPTMPTIKINIFVKRIVADAAGKQVWMLDGGPGIASDDMEDLIAATYLQANGTVDVYTVDHRGTGRSSRLACEAPQAETRGSDEGITISMKEYPACVSNMKTVWGDKSNYFSVTEAARDVLQLIQWSKGTQQVLVYGVSYGTYLAGRMMQLNTDEALISAVVLDGIVAQAGPNRLVFDLWDVKMNQVGMKLLQVCDNDAFCSSKLKNSTTVMNALYDKLFVQQKCKFALPMVQNAATLRKVLGTMLQDVYQRELIPALLYRLNRCDDDIDFGVLNYFFTNYLKNKALDCVSYDSPMLKFNIDMAEFWGGTPLQQIETYFNESNFATGQMQKAQIFEIFTAAQAIYPTDIYFNQTFVTKVPVLMLNGDLDPQTSMESAITQKQNMAASPNAELVIVPFAPHGVIYSTPLNSSGADCGMQLFVSFINDWSKPVDRSCFAHLRGLNFTGAPATNEALFGVHDIFEAFYEPPSVEPVTSLWMLVGAEAGTLLMFSWILVLLIRYAFELNKNTQLLV